MQEGFSLGLIVAAATGMVFAVVTTIEGAIARTVGAVNASLLENLAAGLISAIVITVFFLLRKIPLNATQKAVPWAILAGVLVIIAVAGIGYALPRIGVVAGNMAIVFGQIALAVLIDTVGIGGFERIPLSLARLTGLLLMGMGTYLVLPRQG
jgi:transporter family-2 protein